MYRIEMAPPYAALHAAETSLAALKNRLESEGSKRRTVENALKAATDPKAKTKVPEETVVKMRNELASAEAAVLALEAKRPELERRLADAQASAKQAEGLCRRLGCPNYPRQSSRLYHAERAFEVRKRHGRKGGQGPTGFGGGKKTRRWKKLFCRRDAGLHTLLSTKAFRSLQGNAELRVTTR